MEMAEYIDRDKALASIRYEDPAFSYAIERIPAADVRPVVLCRECKHWETDWTPRGVSDGRHYCAPLDLFPSADWYCADGEKMEGS